MSINERYNIILLTSKNKSKSALTSVHEGERQQYHFSSFH